MAHRADLWRRSTVPVFGIVHDPDDSQLRWVDLTGYLRAHPEQTGGSVPVVGRHTLDELSLRGAFTAAVRTYAARGTTDAWALSRPDPKYLLPCDGSLWTCTLTQPKRVIWLLVLVTK